MSFADGIQAHVAPLVEREGGGPEGWPAALETYLELLEAANRGVNLVSRRTIGEVLEKQIVPSLAALLVIPRGRAVRVLDIGSGGGFPGIPLKILRPEIRIDLVEARRKKVRFLERCLAELGLQNGRAHWCRIEEASEGLQRRAPFDVAFARALGGRVELREACRALPGGVGQVWVFGPPGASEGAQLWRDAAGRVVTALRPLR